MGWTVYLAISSAIIAILHPEFHSFSSQHFQQQSYHITNSGRGPKYYFTDDSADYKGATKACQTLYGGNYGLAAIQTEEDLKAINIFLKSKVSPGVEFWVRGIFHKGEGKWVLDKVTDDSPHEFTPFTPYAVSLFKYGVVPHPTKESVIYYTMVDKSNGHFGTSKPTTSRRFLCEYHDYNNGPVSCDKTDIAVVLDSSYFISFQDFNSAKNGSAGIVRTFAQQELGRQYGNIFSDNVQTVLPLDFIGNIDAKVEKFLDAQYLNGRSNLGGAIEAATDVLKDNQQVGTSQTMVVITSGTSNRGPPVDQVAARARAYRIQMVAVGIGSALNVVELHNIASSPKLVFLKPDWSTLNEILLNITGACAGTL